MQTTFAARAVLNQLNKRFQYFNYLFAEFYDFERGLDPYFRRRLSQVPKDLRGENWVSIMWSRDNASLSYYNRLLQLVRETGDEYSKLVTEVRMAHVNIVFTYISNSIDYLTDFEKYFFSIIPDGFSVMFDNMPYPEWNAKKNIPVGGKFQPRIYSGKLYKCIQAGTTGNTEPDWSKLNTDGTVQDGSVVWQQVMPEQLKVRFEDVAYSGIQSFSLDSDDTLCKLDIGGRMYLPLLLESVDQETGLILTDGELPGTYKQPVILYPRSDVYDLNTGAYLETITPTPEGWEDLNGS